MNCREFYEFLMHYLDEELPLAQRQEFEHHLKKCSCCGAYLDSYKKTVELSRSLGRDPQPAPCEEVPPQLIEAVMRAMKTDS